MNPGDYRFYRLRQAEEMDDPALDPAIHAVALRGLERISTWPGQRKPILTTVLRWARERPGAVSRAGLSPLTRRKGRLRVVELGAGSGHLSRWLAGEMLLRGVPADVIATDLKAGPGVMPLDVGEEKAWPEADIFICNLLWHHLPDDILVRVIRTMNARARIGWLAYDLHRHWAHYYGAWLALRRLHPILRSDGARSIQQGYTRRELRDLTRQAGCERAEIQWHFPFRWMVRYKK